MKSISTEYSILRFEEKDAADLAVLEALCFALPWSEEQYRKVLRAGPDEHSNSPGPAECGPDAIFSLPAPVFGMRAEDGCIAAYLSLGLHHTARELEIYNIAVRPELRGTGLGHLLLSFALGQAAERGFLRAVLEVRPSNEAAMALYSRLGFATCGRRKGYYTDTGEDALVLECMLNGQLQPC